MLTNDSHICPVCASLSTRVFLEFEAMPVLIGVQWQDRGSAQGCARGDISLAFCNDCGFIWNVRFDPRSLEYQQSYENSLHFSRVFQEYTRSVVDRLVRTYDIRGKRVVDIGCGKGDFLTMLCEAGDNFGFGFDPTYEGERISSPAANRIRWFQENYDSRHAKIQADLITSRYVFEHIPSPMPFLSMIRQSISDPKRTIVYFEVPDSDLILRQHSVWDVIYEHCSYFSVESLTCAFARAGFEVLDVSEHYGKQFISIDARVCDGDRSNARRQRWGNLESLAADVNAFGTDISKKLELWKSRIATWRKSNTKVSAWGAGAKAVGFFNMLKVTDEIPHVVDINPRKRNHYLGGTGQKVISPEDLKSDPPDVIILMNPIYRAEVSKTLQELDLSSELIDA